MIEEGSFKIEQVVDADGDIVTEDVTFSFGVAPQRALKVACDKLFVVRPPTHSAKNWTGPLHPTVAMTIALRSRFATRSDPGSSTEARLQL